MRQPASSSERPLVLVTGLTTTLPAMIEHLREDPDGFYRANHLGG